MIGYESVNSCMEFLRSMEGRARMYIRAQENAKAYARSEQEDPKENKPDREFSLPSDSECDEMVRLARAGMPIYCIGHTVKRDRNTVRSALAMRGIDVRGLCQRFSNHPDAKLEDGLKLKQMIESGMSPTRAIMSLGLTARLGYEAIGMAGGVDLKTLRKPNRRK